MKRKTAILALETSADETSAAVFATPSCLSPLVRGRKSGGLQSNVIYSQIARHRQTGGIVPEVAARAHLPKIVPVIRRALAKAGAQLKDIDAIAVTAGPGLITSLRIGVDTGRALAFALNIPIIPINHLEGHLLSALASDPLFLPLTKGEIKRGSIKSGGLFPALGLVASGGHTLLALVKSIGRYKIIGETADDAAGEAFDKIAKLLGLPYPGGPELSALARKGNPQKYAFPRAMLDRNNYDFSFSGLKTAVLYFLRDNPKAGRADIAASAEQAIVDVLVAKTLRAARACKAKAILIGGGVSANKKLQKTLKKEIQKNLDSCFLIPDSNLTGDNAGMIALAAYHHYLAGHYTTFDKVNADPNMELKSWK